VGGIVCHGSGLLPVVHTADVGSEVSRRAARTPMALFVGG
jgi:hypothetical protein